MNENELYRLDEIRHKFAELKKEMDKSLESLAHETSRFIAHLDLLDEKAEGIENRVTTAATMVTDEGLKRVRSAVEEILISNMSKLNLEAKQASERLDTVNYRATLQTLSLTLLVGVLIGIVLSKFFL